MSKEQTPNQKAPTLQQAFDELEEWWPNGFDEDIQRLMAFRLVSLRQTPDNAAAIVGKYDLKKIAEKVKEAEK